MKIFTRMLFITAVFAVFLITSSRATGLPSILKSPSASPCVSINGEALPLAYAPYYHNDEILMVPLRAVAEKIGCKITWNDATQSATVSLAQATVNINTLTGLITSRGRVVPDTHKAQVIGDTLYVPLRTLCESFGCVIGWDESTQTAGVYTCKLTNHVTVGDYSFTLGQTEGDLLAFCGQPTYTFRSEENVMWHVYAKYESALLIACCADGIVIGYYTNSPYFSTASGVKYGDKITSSGTYRQKTENGCILSEYCDSTRGICYAVSGIVSQALPRLSSSSNMYCEARMALDIINSLRYVDEKPALAWDEYAAQSAEKQAKFICESGTLTHVGEGGTTGIARYTALNAGRKWTSWGENICKDARSIFLAVNGWLNSKQHRKLLFSDKTDFGCGYHYNPYAAIKYATVIMFIR